MTPSLQEWQKFAEAQGLRDGVVAPCPCGMPVALGFIGGDPCALHPKPTCAKYDELDPDEFSVYIRKAMTRSLGGETEV